METSQASSSTPTTPMTTSTTGILGTRIPATVAFLLAILLFLLPFAEVRCNNTAVANNTGLGLAIGSEWKEVVSKNIFGGSFETNKADNERDFNADHDPNVFAIVALVLGIIGLLIALLNLKGKVNLFVGLLAALSLIALLIDLKSKARSDTEIKSSNLDLNVGMKISVEGTAWFYLTVILFIIAAFFSWRRSK